MKQIFTIATAILIFMASACSGSKAPGDRPEVSAMELDNIIQTHQSATPSFKTLASRVQVVYEEDERLQSITVSLRMEKDKTIWVKASLLGITLAKVLITPDRVSYYEKVSNTYFDGDFSLLSDWLGTELDFDKAQSILLGQSIFNLNSADYTSAVIQNKYRLLPKRQPTNFIHSLFLDPQTFKVASGSLNQPVDGRQLSIKYSSYQKLGGDYYPSSIIIDSSEKDSFTKIAVTYKKIDLNVDISFPFTIPNGYEEIQLGR